jgi:hypothetical protein
MSKRALNEEKMETYTINFLKTSSWSEDQILSSKKIFFRYQSHHKYLILRYVSLIR